METIGNLWLLWLIGVLASLGYFLWLSWGFFALVTRKDDVRNDPHDNALTALTLKTFWPLILTCVFLVLLLIGAFYRLVLA